MKCQTCSEDVPQKFAYAIAMNVCPLCGQQIMEPELQKVLNSLREVMSEASELDYQEEAFDWLNSNFKLIRSDGEEFLGLKQEVEKLKSELQESRDKYSKPTPRSGRANLQSGEVQMGTDNEGNEVQLHGESIQDPDRTQVFLQRAQASKMAEKNNHYRKMVDDIKKKAGGSMGAGDAGGSAGGGGMGAITPEMIMAASPEEVEEMEAMLSGGMPGISSAIDSDYDDDDNLGPVAESLIAMGGRGKSQSGDYNARDVAKLQALQSKSSHASKALDRGGSVGLIRR